MLFASDYTGERCSRSPRVYSLQRRGSSAPAATESGATSVETLVDNLGSGAMEPIPLH